ncbi:MAG: response regulator [Rhodospirillales bacterium]|jgi:CheY-like chemotaxis protein|nr:response regulator [Rhodospirillales bacterium]
MFHPYGHRAGAYPEDKDEFFDFAPPRRNAKRADCRWINVEEFIIALVSHEPEIMEAEFHVSQGSRAVAKSHPNQLSVMIIEPNLSMRSIMRRIVQDIGVAEIHEASDIAEGYKKIKEAPVDLIFTDWSADVDALRFLRLIRRGEDSPDPRVPVVVVTANTDLEAVFKARDTGMTEFLSKPISQKMVLSRIKSAIGKPRMFIDAGEFFGPGRRRRRIPFDGNERRSYSGEERRTKVVGHEGPERRQDSPDYKGDDSRGGDR